MTPRRYTEEQFRTAVADPEVRTLADLCRALGLVPRGANYETVREYGRALDIDVDHELAWRRLDLTEAKLLEAAQGARSAHQVLQSLEVNGNTPGRHELIRQRLRRLGVHLAADDDPDFKKPPRGRRSYSDGDLLRALDDASIDGYPALCEALGLRPHTATYLRLRTRARELGRPIPEAWSRTGPRAGQPNRRPPDLFDERELRDAVVGVTTIADVLRRLGQSPSAATYAKARRSFEAYEIDTSHLTGIPAVSPRQRPLRDVLGRNTRASSARLRHRLLEEGLLERKCDRCHETTWQGKPIPLELDHIDGDRSNNLLENLRVLCPNCHALTPTYRGRNIGRSRMERPPP